MNLISLLLITAPDYIQKCKKCDGYGSTWYQSDLYPEGNETSCDYCDTVGYIVNRSYNEPESREK